MKADLGWSLALRPCAMLIVRLASRLLYFLFGLATRRLVAPGAQATIVPPAPGASSGFATDQRSFTMALKPRGQILCGRYWMLPIELHERVLG
jgi:hypothetical protein